MGALTVKLVQRDGTEIRTLVDVNVGRLVRPVGKIPTTTITFPKHDPAGAIGQAADMRLLREFQIFRGASTKPYFWGVALGYGASTNAGEVTFQLVGTEIYFGRRKIARPLTNLLTNGRFETGDLSGWTQTGLTAAAITTAPVRRGSYAARISQATTFGDASLTQAFSVTGTAVGTNVTVAGHVLIESFAGPAKESRGIYIQGSVAGVRQAWAVATIDAATPRGEWQRFEALINVPALTTWDITAGVWCPDGTIVVDELEVVIPESLATSSAGDDIATTAGRIVDFIQSPDKGDLGFTTSTPATGVLYARAWQYIDETFADQALAELVALGIDISVEHPDASTKQVTTWHPFKGTDRTGTVTLSLGVNVASCAPTGDASSTATDQTMLGDGDGPDRETGYARDTTYTDGLLLEGLSTAPPGTTINALDPMAQDRLDRTKRPIELHKLTTYQGAGDLIELLEEGDVVDVVVDDGWIQISGAHRILIKDLDERSETLDLTVERWG